MTVVTFPSKLEPCKSTGFRLSKPSQLELHGELGWAPDSNAFYITESDGLTAVRLKVEENQLVDVFGEIGVLVDGLKGA